MRQQGNGDSTIILFQDIYDLFVMVHGKLKGFQGKKQLMVYSVRPRENMMWIPFLRITQAQAQRLHTDLSKPVTDYNEIANHFADCIYVHCHNTRLRKLHDAAQVPGHMPNSAVTTPSKGYQTTPSNHISVQYNTDGVMGPDKIVLTYLQQPACLAREKGVHCNELAQQLNLPEKTISYRVTGI